MLHELINSGAIVEEQALAWWNNTSAEKEVLAHSGAGILTADRSRKADKSDVEKSDLRKGV